MIVLGEEVGIWVGEKAKTPWTWACQAIGWERDGQLVAGVMYDTFTGASVCMHSRVESPHKVSRTWLAAIFDYPFNQLRLKRVTATASTANARAIALNEHCGFVREAILRDYYEDGDAIIYMMTADRCKWLQYADKYLQDLRTEVQTWA